MTSRHSLYLLPCPPLPLPQCHCKELAHLSQTYHVIHMLIFMGRRMKQESARDPLQFVARFFYLKQDAESQTNLRARGDPSPGKSGMQC